MELQHLRTNKKYKKLMDIAGFKKLLIWQKAMNLTVEIYKLTDKLPAEEKYGLISQMRRSSVSIPSNIAEGYGRYSDPELSHFLRIARGSLYELVTQVALCKMLGFIEAKDEEKVDSNASEIDRMTISFIKKIENKQIF